MALSNYRDLANTPAGGRLGNPYGARNPAGASQKAPLSSWQEFDGRYKATVPPISSGRGDSYNTWFNQPPRQPGGKTAPGSGDATAPGAGGAVPPPSGTGFGQGPPPMEKASSPYGSQSGPGILENWFNQRATGTDAASVYATKRGLDALGDRFSSAGGYNSGAARQADADLIANIEAQRAGQLDSLAGGASAEHQGRLDSMFRSGAGIAGGQAGIGSAYDLGAAGNIAAANNAINQMNLNKAGVDSQANQALFNNILKAYSAYQGGSS